MVGLSTRLAAAITLTGAAHPPEFGSARAWRSTPAGKPFSCARVMSPPRFSRGMYRNHDTAPITAALPTPTGFGSHGQYPRPRPLRGGSLRLSRVPLPAPVLPVRCGAFAGP